MVTTEMDEARRVELARQAVQLVGLQEQIDKMQQEKARRVERERARHKREMEKIAQFEREAISSKRSAYRRAKAAMGELKASVPRDLVRKESDARTKVNKTARRLKEGQAEVKRAQAFLAQHGGKPGRDLVAEIAVAEERNALLAQELERASAEWEEARAVIDAALRALLALPEEDEETEDED